MVYRKSIRFWAETLLHPEHSETQNIVHSTHRGGSIGGGLALVLVVATFIYLHLVGADAVLSWRSYLLWLVAGMAFTFFSATVGMLIGIFYSLAKARWQFMKHHKEALDDAFVEIQMRHKIRKVISS